MSITIRIEQQPEIELNYSNRNAGLVLGQIGIDIENGFGVITHDAIPALRRTLLRLLNQTAALPSVAPQEEWRRCGVNNDGIPTMERNLCHVDPGIDQEGVARRLREIADLLARASDLHSDVSWY